MADKKKSLLDFLKGKKFDPFNPSEEQKDSRDKYDKVHDIEKRKPKKKYKDGGVADSKPCGFHKIAIMVKKKKK